MKVFARVGILKEIWTNRGSNFSSKRMRELCELLKINTLKMSVYHPQTIELLVQFNRTLKSMLKKLIDTDPLD